MKIELTKDEQALLVQTVETSTYTGALARLVADLLDRLKEVEELEE